MKSNGFVELWCFGRPRATSRWSATNSMYWHINSKFMPISATGRASRDMSTELVDSNNVNLRVKDSARWWQLYIMTSLEKESRPRHFLSQKIECKWTGENYAPDRECNKTLRKCWLTIRDPCKGPVGFLFNARYRLHSIEKMLSPCWVFDIGIGE